MFSMLALSILLFVLLPLIVTLVFVFLFMRASFESINEYEWYRGACHRRREPFRWVSPSWTLSGVSAPRLNEVQVYKELVNHVSRMYHEGRVSLEVRDRVIGDLMEKIRMFEGGQDGSSKASS